MSSKKSNEDFGNVKCVTNIHSFIHTESTSVVMPKMMSNFDDYDDDDDDDKKIILYFFQFFDNFVCVLTVTNLLF
ncbi:hypothetical protein DERF_012726 [Dermatophagoides farinae]|uniref:Transmembrane protein n=1 Tax=Dermatophagoides farinae TaxID=6954 RepID=A0A922KYT6_DERFA|nr:hypothetical protein DERF_012726 [Dermatophagoides farinae]